MKEKFALLGALLAAALPAHAGTYQVGHAQECPGLRQRQVFNTLNQVGIEEDLSLPKGQQITGRMLCYQHPTLQQDGMPVYVYTFRATIEKSIKEGNSQRWILLRDSLERTGYGIGTSAGLDEAIRRESRNLIRMLK